MVSYVLVGLGLLLFAFGVIGVRSPTAIVEKQRAEGMTAYADAPIDDATRARVTRYAAAACLLVGSVLVVVGLDPF